MAKTKEKATRALTPEQRKLVEIMVTRDRISMTQAGLMAGYSEKTAAQTASRALKLPHVKAYHDQLIAERSKRTGIDADYVLRRLVEIDELDIADILDENGAFLPVNCWPRAWRQMIKAIDIRKGKVTLPDKIGALQLIGKHTGVRAFVDQIEVEKKGGFADRLTDALAALEAEAEASK